MPNPEPSVLLPAVEDGWRTQHRELCREFDVAQRLAGDLRGALAGLLSAQVPRSSLAGHEQALAALRNLSIPLDVSALKSLIYQCLLHPVTQEAGISNWLVLFYRLQIPEPQSFEARHLRDKATEGRIDPLWVSQMASFLNDCIATAPLQIPALPATNAIGGLFASLFDGLSLPPDFESKALKLRESLEAGSSVDAVQNVRSFLNEVQAVARQDVRSLGEYLKRATQHLHAIETDLTSALQGSQEIVSVSAQFSAAFDTDVAAIDRAINGDVPISELKK